MICPVGEAEQSAPKRSWSHDQNHLDARHARSEPVSLSCGYFSSGDARSTRCTHRMTWNSLFRVGARNFLSVFTSSSGRPDAPKLVWRQIKNPSQRSVSQKAFRGATALSKRLSDRHDGSLISLLRPLLTFRPNIKTAPLKSKYYFLASFSRNHGTISS